MAKNRIFETATNTYSAEGSIGNGGVGTVFRVRDVDDVRYALKLMGDVTSAQCKRFKNELNFCRNQRHERIIKVIDEGVVIEGEKRHPFYVMPLCASSLRQLMMSKKPLPNPMAIFQDILDGVEAAHLCKVIHRDLKPENILVDKDGRAIVADFGIAHFQKDDLFTLIETKPTDRLANFQYAAPEQRDPGGRECQLICVNCLSLVDCHGYGRCRMPAEAGGRSGATSPGAGWHPARLKLPGWPVAARGRSSQIAASPPANPARISTASRHSAAPNTTA
jgi:serine/threonine protein kinase